MRDLRCNYKKHGVVIDSHTVEIKCDSKFCGAQRGIIILHWFDLETGKLVKTKRFKEIRRK